MIAKSTIHGSILVQMSHPRPTARDIQLHQRRAWSDLKHSVVSATEHHGDAWLMFVIRP